MPIRLVRWALVVDRVTAAAGLAVGLLRRLTRLPETLPGLIADLREEHFSPRLVPGSWRLGIVADRRLHGPKA